VILAKYRQALVIGDVNVARGGLELTAEQLQEGGFARAIGANDAVAVAGGEFEVNILEQDLTAEMKAEIVNGNHVYSNEILSIFSFFSIFADK
jgi:hypothetical protein